MELLHIDRRDLGGWTVVEVQGQIDAATAPQLRQALVEAQYGTSTRLLLDLDGVEFMDSMGLGVIVGALKRARSQEGELVIACTRPRVRQLLDLTRISEIVRVVADRSEIAGA